MHTHHACSTLPPSVLALLADRPVGLQVLISTMAASFKNGKNVQYHKILTYFLYGPFFLKSDTVYSIPSLLYDWHKPRRLLFWQGDYFSLNKMSPKSDWLAHNLSKWRHSHNCGHCTFSVPYLYFLANPAIQVPVGTLTIYVLYDI